MDDVGRHHPPGEGVSAPQSSRATNLQRPFGSRVAHVPPPAPYPRRSEEEDEQDDAFTLP